MTRVWDFVTKPKVLLHDDGYFIFKFNSLEEKELVSHSGPYYYNNKPTITIINQSYFEHGNWILN